MLIRHAASVFSELAALPLTDAGEEEGRGLDGDKSARLAAHLTLVLQK